MTSRGHRPKAKSPSHPIRAIVGFVSGFATNWKQTGSIIPSSRSLARAMTSILPDRHHRRKPLRILEVGAGTGAITSEILKAIRPDDTLVVYELSQEFARILEARRVHDPDWRDRGMELRVLPFPEGVTGEQFDFAICSLPFNNFPSTLVRKCMAAFEETLAEDGKLAFFEYCHVRNVRLRIGREKTEFIRLKRIDTILSDYLNRHRISRKMVRLNVPPAWVHILQFKDEALHPS